MSLDNIDNFGSDSSLNQDQTVSIDHLKDPIIQKMLEDRRLDDSTLTLADELERQSRMYIMLR